MYVCHSVDFNGFMLPCHQPALFTFFSGTVRFIFICDAKLFNLYSDCMFTTKSESIASHFLDRSLNLSLFLEHQLRSPKELWGLFPPLLYHNWCSCNQVVACQILVGNVLVSCCIYLLISQSNVYHCQAVILDIAVTKERGINHHWAVIWRLSSRWFGPVQKGRPCEETQDQHYSRVLAF